MSRPEHPEHLGRIRSVLQQAIHLEKASRIEVEGVRLHPSEIHVLLLVDAGHGTNASRMAERLGVTKGAISQTLTRLVRKGLMTKRHDPRARNELTLSFTPLGRRAAADCRKVQDTIQRRFDAYLSSIEKEDREAVGRFLEQMQVILGDALR